jgi:FkbM family methyltransferase
MMRLFFSIVLSYFSLFLYAALPEKPGGINSLSFLYHSLKGQDRWLIEEIYDQKEEGFFVDLAAFDGVHGNNTYALEKGFQWRGICIEASPLLLPELRKNRSAIIEPACIDYTNHSVEFRIDNGWLGGIVDHDTQNNFAYRGKEIQKAHETQSILRLETKTLEQVLDEHKAPRIIDYLSLDAEGAETRILKYFPFHRYTFLAITIERPSEQLHSLLIKNDYLFIKTRHFCAFYLHKTHPKSLVLPKEPFTSLPEKTW